MNARFSQSCSGNAEKRELLNLYIESRDEIEELAERIIRLRARAEKITSTLSRTPGCGSSELISDKVQRYISEALALEEAYSRRIDQNLAMLGALESAIDRLPKPRYRQLMRMKYIDGASWEEIASAMNYSPRHLQREMDRLLSMLDLPDARAFTAIGAPEKSRRRTSPDVALYH